MANFRSITDGVDFCFDAFKKLGLFLAFMMLRQSKNGENKSVPAVTFLLFSFYIKRQTCESIQQSQMWPKALK